MKTVLFLIVVAVAVAAIVLLLPDDPPQALVSAPLPASVDPLARGNQSPPVAAIAASMRCTTSSGLPYQSR